MTGANRELPILFNGAMVRAFLARRKRQTRRILRTIPGVSLEEMVASGFSLARWQRHPINNVRCRQTPGGYPT